MVISGLRGLRPEGGTVLDADERAELARLPERAPARVAPRPRGPLVAFVGFGRGALSTASALVHAGCTVAWLPPSDGWPSLPDETIVSGLAGSHWLARPDDPVDRSATFELGTTDATLRRANVVFVGTPASDEPGPARLARLGRACARVVANARRGQNIIVTDTCYVGCTRDLLLEPLRQRGLTPGGDVDVELAPGWCAPGMQLDRSTVDRLAARRSRRRVPGGTGRQGADCARPPDRPILTFEAEMLKCLRDARRGRRAKRLLDVVVAALGLLLLSPLLLAIALAILLDDGRPILFTQVRVGMNGRLFRFRKFRTMVDGAEKRLAEVLALNQIRGPGFQIANDPRQTRVGAVLRRTSLDELPQLWNVLVGDMSLVGPRPAPVCEVTDYLAWHRRRLAVKPGITGLAQIRARCYRDFDEKACLDAEYIDQWSLKLDLSILMLTVPAVLRMTGR